MRLVSLVLLLSGILIVAAGATGCGDALRIGRYQSIPGAVLGDFGAVRDFAGPSEVTVTGFTDRASLSSTASIGDRSMMVSVDVDGPFSFSALAPGTRLYGASTASSGILRAEFLGEEDATEFDAQVGLGAGIEGPMATWLGIPADEFVIVVEATEDAGINEITVHAGATNPETEEFDVVSTQFRLRFE